MYFLMVKILPQLAMEVLGITIILLQIGQELVLHSSKEVFLVEMLMSLSKLASKSIFLISEQSQLDFRSAVDASVKIRKYILTYFKQKVDLLLSFLTRESTLPVQTTTLRCLRFLVVGGVCRFPVNAILIKTLFHVLDKAELPPDSQCEALWILNKVFLYTLLNLPYMDMLEFVKLLPIIENAAQSPIKLKRFLALRLLVNVSCNIKGRVEMVSDGDCSTHLPSRVIVLVIDQITLLVKQVQKPCWPDSEVKRECQSLLNLILHLVEEHPEKGVLALDVIRSSIESLMNMHGGGMGKKPSGSVHEIATKSEKCPSVVSKLVFCVYSFLETCLEKLDEAGAVTTQILHKVKLLVEVIHQSSLFDHVIHAIYSLLLHSHVMWDLLGNVNKETHNLDKDNGITLNDYWVEHESFTLEFAKKMMSGGDNWSAYKVGKYAACHGAWFAATFTFWQLTKKVQSDSCYYWLKSLALFSHAESEIQLLLFPKQGISLVSGLEMNTIWVTPFGDALGDGVRDFAWHANLQDYSEKLARVCSSVCSSEQMLGATVTSGQTFYFQRWFLVVRAKVLETVVDILRLLRTNPCDKEIIGNSGQVERSTMVDYLGLTQQIHSLAHFLTQISFRLKRLAQEFDLLATSFIGIDTKSFRIISMLALSCSLLAFCTGFALYFPHLPAYKSSIACGLENADKFSHSMLIQNLVERLWHVDSETCTNLKLLLTIIGEPKRCFPLQSRTQISSVGHNERDTLIICSFAVSGFLHLQKEAKGVNNEGVLSRVSQAGLQLLLDILKKWMYLPFRIPKYFFQVRSCVGVELFAFNACTRNPKNPDGIFILPGYHLSLNLCLQMKDVPPDLPVRPTKLYCILACRTCYRMPILNGENKEFMWSGFRAWETDEMVDLNEKLLQYARKAKQRVVSDDCGGSVYAQLCFELNERGQGFSTCMLDVSAFPVGSYKIKWHSCCIDNQGSYWSLLPLNTGPVFTIKNPPVGG
ncbi:hypothetical protein HHK36_025313 [Tetracentron sinense]|uniref:Integrator complex subunit 7-like C-terminal domain-containing protein n=1 Tax=Tetracentron sinense TaxID=13715 RepID=A0A834YMG1_TETSI|nr:hypothetical protein HHK36_025313 [Tetracentron sinense]